MNANMNGAIVGKTIGYFLATSFFNAVLGILLAIAIQPGSYLSGQVRNFFLFFIIIFFKPLGEKPLATSRYY